MTWLVLAGCAWGGEDATITGLALSGRWLHLRAQGACHYRARMLGPELVLEAYPAVLAGKKR